MGLYIALGVISLFVLFVLTVLIRTFAFRPKKVNKPAPDPVSFDGEKALSDLSAMIRCKTVSHVDSSLDDEAEFDKVADYFDNMFDSEEDYDA